MTCLPGPFRLWASSLQRCWPRRVRLLLCLVADGARSLAPALLRPSPFNGDQLELLTLLGAAELPTPLQYQHPAESEDEAEQEEEQEEDPHLSQLDALEASWSDHALAVRADMTDPREVELAFAQAVKRFGALHGCAVNAGVWPVDDTPLVDMHDARVRTTLGINLEGAIWASRAFLRSTRSAGPSQDGVGASLVYTGSPAAKFGEKGHCDYAASKAGLYGLMRSLKNEIVDIAVRERNRSKTNETHHWLHSLHMIAGSCGLCWPQ